ncbi:MAG: L-threonylcarbamoyladenylate synthase [Candidatus Bathyarchaeia archaeon]
MKRVRVISLDNSIEDAVSKADIVLREGGLVIYPTESCYALGADALSPDAVKKVYAAKERPLSLPLPVIVADEAMWERYAVFTPEALTLIRRFSPGPLTIVLKKKPIVPDILNPSALAARVSSHPVASQLVSRFGSPVVSTSANVHGGEEPYDVWAALDSLASFEGLALDGGRLPRRPVSTVVDLTVRPYRIQRAFPEGAIEEDAIRRVLEGGSR